MDRIASLVHRLLHDEDGAALLEYGILVLLIALLCIAAIRTIGSKVSSSFSAADNALP